MGGRQVDWGKCGILVSLTHVSSMKTRAENAWTNNLKGGMETHEHYDDANLSVQLN